MRQAVEVIFDGSALSAKDYECWESRGALLAELIEMSFADIDKEDVEKMKPFSVEIYAGDYWPGHPYCFSAEEYHDGLVPDFQFMGWPEVGYQDYEEVCKEIVEASERDVKYDQLFWAGNSNTHVNRKKFLEIVPGDPRVHAHDIGNWSPDPEQGGKLKTGSGVFITLPDHCNYKYLIDIEGHGYSGRVKYLLHTGRPLFYQARPWNEYFFFDMEPFVHYIPVEREFSDFYEKLEWAMDNEEECIKIGKNAQEFALKNLRRQNAIDRYKEMFLRLGEVECTTTL